MRPELRDDEDTMNAIRRLAIYAVQAAGTAQDKPSVGGGNDGSVPPPDSRLGDEPVAQSQSRSATRG